MFHVGLMNCNLDHNEPERVSNLGRLTLTPFETNIKIDDFKTAKVFFDNTKSPISFCLRQRR